MSEYNLSVDGKRILVLLVNQKDLLEWQRVLGKKSVCMVVERSERPDLFDAGVGCDRMMITLEDMSTLCDLIEMGTARKLRC